MARWAAINPLAKQILVAPGDHLSNRFQFLALLAVLHAMVAETAAQLQAFGNSGMAVAWGANNQQQCAVPVALGPVRSIAGGWTHSVALTPDGRIVAWGDNQEGACTVPPGLGRCKQVSAGAGHTLALTETGAVFAWGSNWAGQCNVPTDLGPCIAIAATEVTSHALLADGRLRGWGYNAGGDYNVPAWIKPCTTLSGRWHHCIVLQIDGVPAGYGSNTWGQCLVPPDTGPCIDAAAGGTHSAALRSDGTARCWGTNGSGECNVPTGAIDLSRICAGFGFTAALTRSGSAIAWGAAPSLPPDLQRMTFLHAGSGHLCAIAATAASGHAESGELGPFGFTAPKSWSASLGAAAPRGAAWLSILAKGDFGSSNEFLTVRAEGIVIATGIFGTAGADADCGSQPLALTLMINAETLSALAADGRIDFSIEPSIGVSAAACSSASLQVTLDWQFATADCDTDGWDDACNIAVEPRRDCDRDATLDSCLIEEGVLADCDESGFPDACELAAGAPDENNNGSLDICEVGYGDFDLSGAIDGMDLAALLSLWGVANPPYGDLDRDGLVGGADLGLLLGRWG